MEQNNSEGKRKNKILSRYEAIISLEIDKKKLQLAIKKLSKLNESLPEYGNAIPIKLIIDPNYSSTELPKIHVEPPPTDTPNEPGRITITAGGGRATNG